KTFHGFNLSYFPRPGKRGQTGHAPRSGIVETLPCPLRVRDCLRRITPEETAMNRRQMLLTAGAGAAALLLPRGARADEPAGFTLPKLPYEHDALEPIIDKMTMEIHHGRHHKTYVDNLNKALKDHPELMTKPAEELVAKLKEVPETVRGAVRNN